jgi:hypothetical protein
MTTLRERHWPRFVIAMIVLAFIGLIGLGATFLLPTAEPAEPLPAPDTATSH